MVKLVKRVIKRSMVLSNQSEKKKSRIDDFKTRSFLNFYDGTKKKKKKL